MFNIYRLTLWHNSVWRAVFLLSYARWVQNEWSLAEVIDRADKGKVSSIRILYGYGNHW